MYPRVSGVVRARACVIVIVCWHVDFLCYEYDCSRHVLRVTAISPSGLATFNLTERTGLHGPDGVLMGMMSVLARGMR